VTAIFRILCPLVLSRYSEGPARVEDLDRLSGAAAAMDDLSAWIAEITLDPPISTGDLAGPPHLDEDYVVISTVHSAKGLECCSAPPTPGRRRIPSTWHSPPGWPGRRTPALLRRDDTRP